MRGGTKDGKQKRPSRRLMRSVELFTGAGGLALGASLAGFKHEILVEWNRYACDTLRHNSSHKLAKKWRVHEGDIAKFDFGSIKADVDLLAGGPPCQPFSIGGKHKGMDDKRNLFPEYFRAVRTLTPKALIIENVRGLTRKAFSSFFEYIKLSLTYPELDHRQGEDWTSHHQRLQQHHTSGSNHTSELTYNILARVVNAADYGAPQVRWRVVFVGFRSDVAPEWSFPEPTHTSEALILDKWHTGDYWERHGISKRRRPERPSKISDRLLGALVSNGVEGSPWRTVRDALADIPDPQGYSGELTNHIFQDGAKVYAGHTGSPLDEPSKALKAGVHGVPGGENMIAYPDGSVRYLTVREAARIQTFPDDYLVTGAWGEAMRQLGNAVPVCLGEAVAKGVAKHIRAA